MTDSIIAGKDPNDNYTLAQPSIVPAYKKALNTNMLKGKRIETRLLQRQHHWQ